MNPEPKNSNYLIILVYVFVITLIGYFFVIKNDYLHIHLVPIRIGNIVFNKDLVKEAEITLPGTDYVIHLEDMHIEWTSDKLTDIFGYSQRELLAKKNFELAPSSHLSKEQYLKNFLKRITENEENYTIITQRSDKSDVLIEVTYKTFIYKNQSFLAGKVINYRTPTAEEVNEFELENR